MNTKLTKLLGLEHPILNAPMAPQAGGALAAAVSRAGAFGMLGFDYGETAESLAEQVALVRAEVAGQFGIGLTNWVVERRPELTELALSANPKLVSFSFGDPKPFVARFHDAGILVAAQVQSKAWMTSALAAGVDIIVAQGTEAGGHTGSVGTLPMLQIALEMAGDLPVVAAGGIATGRGLAAVLAAGASGAWVGTPFLLAREARTNDAAQQRLIESDETQTVLTSVFDRVQNLPWPDEFRGRALRNAFTERWDAHEDEISDTARASFQVARKAHDYSVAHLYAGQSVGLARRVESAVEIVHRISGEAAERLRAVAALL